jgi:hypothetical protein
MRLCVLAFLILAGCDSPSPMLGRAEPTRLTVDGHDITVWRSDDRVEAIRHGFARRSEMSGLRATLMQAMRQATGCDLRKDSVEGDIGVLRAKLDCDT